ncbi:hypothetical protein HMPREF9370_2256 [Neisseria wadsworthii 9715]|uniref:Uncharacterized protein n=1 Tax=Neisseria wadsworthii 9715 TaxID=1030841 RepID=G4CT46_9NEIS|nr:hypothetical protein HMPREF9370_2256 [Neisseria wadsworthii 9715]
MLTSKQAFGPLENICMPPKGRQNLKRKLYHNVGKNDMENGNDLASSLMVANPFSDRH